MVITYDDQNVRQCPYCGGKLMTTQDAEIVCSKCGIVLEEKQVSYYYDARVFDLEDMGKRRYGPVSTYLENQLKQTMMGEDKDGKRLPAKVRARYSKLLWLDQRINNIDRNIRSAAADYLLSWKYKLNIPEPLLDRAMQLYNALVKRRLHKGRKLAAVAAAALILAYRENNVPLRIQTVLDLAMIRSHDLVHVLRLYEKLGEGYKSEFDTDSVPQYISSIASKLRITEHQKRLALQIFDDIKKNDTLYNEMIAGKSPVSIAAALIYFVLKITGSKIAQKIVASAAEITEVSVRNRYSDLIQYAVDILQPYLKRFGLSANNLRQQHKKKEVVEEG